MEVKDEGEVCEAALNMSYDSDSAVQSFKRRIFGRTIKTIFRGGTSFRSERRMAIYSMRQRTRSKHIAAQYTL